MSLLISGDLRLAKGQPVPNDPNFAFNSLLLHGNGTNGSTVITDSSGSPKTVTAVGNAQISTAIADPFGNSARGVIAFDGTGDYLTMPNSTVFEFGVNDFTIEFWWWRTATSLGGLVDLGLNYGGIGIYQSSTLTVRVAGSDVIDRAIFSANQWVHVALSRSSTSLKLFFNGAQQGATATNSTNLINSFGTVAVGAFVSTGSYFATPAAYIDDLRITKGVARYTSNFTPPTAPFPDF
jgi:hypothetical protein